MTPRGQRRPPVVLLLLTVAVLGLVLSGASLPHAHGHHGGAPGFFNHDHDLTLLATLGVGATLPDAPAAMACAVVIGAVGLSLLALFPAPPHRRPSSRAPPVR